MTGRPAVVMLVNGTVPFPSPRENLIAAMNDAGLQGVDLSIGSASVPLLQLVTSILRPRAFIPNHLGSFFSPFGAVGGVGRDRASAVAVCRRVVTVAFQSGPVPLYGSSQV